jgi:hypothetical protein
MDEQTYPKPERDAKGHWLPGVSGRPTGRKKGERPKASLAVEAMLQGEVQSLTRKAIELALAGDTTALKLCLERLLPPAKGRHVQLDWPAITSAAAAVEAMAQVTEAVGSGEITTDEGAALAAIVEAGRRMVETADLERRIEALEKVHAEQT